MRNALIVVLLGLLLASAVPTADALQESPDADNTVTRIDVRADGDARWTVTVRTRLRTDADVRDYRAFQERFRENTSRYLDPFRDRINGVVATAADDIGRDMRATNVSASTSIQEVPRRWGVVSYEFTWTAFAATDGDTLRTGDVFAGGFFIATNDTLVVSAPPGYTIASATPDPDETEAGTVRWDGRREFADGRPNVAFEPAGSENSGDTGVTLLAVALLGVLALGGGALAYRRRGDDTAAGSGPILTDGDRVEQLLRERDGRAKQSEIAEALDWSASKTSRTVSRLADEDRVEKLRIGRENVVSLPDEDEQ